LTLVACRRFNWVQPLLVSLTAEFLPTIKQAAGAGQQSSIRDLDFDLASVRTDLP